MGQDCSICPQIALGFHLELDRALTIAETCVEMAGRGCVDRNPQEAGPAVLSRPSARLPVRLRT